MCLADGPLRGCAAGALISSVFAVLMNPNRQTPPTLAVTSRQPRVGPAERAPTDTGETDSADCCPPECCSCGRIPGNPRHRAAGILGTVGRIRGAGGAADTAGARALEAVAT